MECPMCALIAMHWEGDEEKPKCQLCEWEKFLKERSKLKNEPGSKETHG